jgi:peroxiredoxin
MRVRFRLVSGAANTALLLTTLTTALDATADKVHKAPSIQLKTLDGQTVRLADHKGRVVVIDFWASWCAPCKATFPALNTLAGELRDKGVDVFAVSEDEKRKDLDAFLAEHRPSIDVLWDAKGNAASAFSVTMIPSMYVIDQSGMIRFSHPNYSADVLDAVKTEVASLSTPRP